MNKTILGIIIVVAIAIVAFMFLGGDSDSNVNPTLNADGQGKSQVALTGETKTVEITASNWEFNPPLVEVNKGDLVELHLKSSEGTHGFTILEFGVAETLRPGDDVHTSFIADKEGTFNFFCHIPCGRGHGGMRGLFVVK